MKKFVVAALLAAVVLAPGMASADGGYAVAQGTEQPEPAPETPSQP